MDTISHIRPWYDQLSQALHTIYIGSVYSYNNFQQIVVWIAANLILTTNDITESIQWGYAPNTYARRLESEENQTKIMKIMKNAKPVIVKPITKLINKSISSAKFPDNLKEAITQEK